MSANETPRTDSAAVTQNLSWGQIGMVPADFARTLERELAEAKADANLQRTRLGAILWSGALDKVTAGEVQDWTKDYQTSLTAATQRIAELEAHAERLAEQLVFSLKMSKHNPYFIAARHAEAESVLADYRAAKETKLP